MSISLTKRGSLKSLTSFVQILFPPKNSQKGTTPTKSMMNHPLNTYLFAILGIDLTVSQVSGSLYSVRKFMTMSKKKQTSTMRQNTSRPNVVVTLKQTWQMVLKVEKATKRLMTMSQTAFHLAFSLMMKQSMQFLFLVFLSKSSSSP